MWNKQHPPTNTTFSYATSIRKFTQKKWHLLEERLMFMSLWWCIWIVAEEIKCEIKLKRQHTNEIFVKIEYSKWCLPPFNNWYAGWSERVRCGQAVEWGLRVADLGCFSLFHVSVHDSLLVFGSLYQLGPVHVTLSWGSSGSRFFGSIVRSVRVYYPVG